jgi:hypothetical protein
MTTTDNRPLFVAPRSMLENKPQHGAACTSCGLCCVALRCDLAMQVFALPRVGACPALVQTDAKRFACGLVLEAETEAKRAAALLIIGSGDGCDARFNGEPRNEAFAAALDNKYANLRRELQAAFKLWER